jgi:hypothetical protein
MQYPSTFQVMEPNVFLGQPVKVIADVLCSFEDEHYPSNKYRPMVYIIFVSL